MDITDEMLKAYEPGYAPERRPPTPATQSLQPITLEKTKFTGEGDDGGVLLDDGAVRVPPGRYEAVYESHETRPPYRDWASKLVIFWRVTTPGPAEGAVLPKIYNVRELYGEPRKSGGFGVGSKSAYYRDYCLLAGRPKRNDRLSPIAFSGKTVLLEVADVEFDGDRKAIVGDARYSVVRQIIGET